MLSFGVLLDDQIMRRFVKHKIPLFPLLPFVSSTDSVRLMTTSPLFIARSLSVELLKPTHYTINVS